MFSVLSSLLVFIIIADMLVTVPNQFFPTVFPFSLFIPEYSSLAVRFAHSVVLYL